MTGNVFDYTDYKKYVGDRLSFRARNSRGERTRVAQALRCHLAYVSRVLNGDAHFSMEQAEALSRYLGHSKNETDFFLNLVHYGKAGTPELRAYYSDKISEEAEKRSNLKHRLDYQKSLSTVHQSVYFSTWYFAAIHLLLSIPELQTRENLARYLRLPAKRVAEVLQFLVSSGLATEKKGRYQRGPTSIHLGNDSPMISKHHINWKIQAIQAIERESPDELHYSSAVTVSRKHVAEIRKILVKAIEDVRATVKPSPDEVLFCYTLDLFEVGGYGAGSSPPA